MAFATLYAPGPNWQAGKGLTEQPGWHDHLEYWRRMMHEHGMRVVGVPASDSRRILLEWPAGTREAVERWAGSAPLVSAGVLAAITVEGGFEP